VLLHVQNSLTYRNVANVKRDIKQKIMDLNVPIVLVRDTLKNIVRRRMEKGPIASINYLEVLVNNEEATLAKLN